MRYSLMVALTGLLAVGPVGAQETPPQSNAARTEPAHTPEWTQPGQGDPGREGHTEPSQTKVLIAPGPATDEESGAAKFGDGVRGSRPPIQRPNESGPAEGDPDQPVITGQVPNGEGAAPDRHEATHVIQQGRGDDG